MTTLKVTYDFYCFKEERERTVTIEVSDLMANMLLDPHPEDPDYNLAEKALRAMLTHLAVLQSNDIRAELSRVCWICEVL